jgi:hypothetical protein
MNNLYVSYKFYDDHKRRLAIFGEHFPESNIIEIAVFTCSNKDHYSKKTAREAFELLCKSVNECNEHHFHPMLSVIDVVDNKPGKSFITWCEEHFYKRRQYVHRIPVIRDIFYNKSEVLSKKDIMDYSLLNKMDLYA